MANLRSVSRVHGGYLLAGDAGPQLLADGAHDGPDPLAPGWDWAAEQYMGEGEGECEVTNRAPAPVDAPALPASPSLTAPASYSRDALARLLVSVRCWARRATEAIDGQDALRPDADPQRIAEVAKLRQLALSAESHARVLIEQAARGSAPATAAEPMVEPAKAPMPSAAAPATPPAPAPPIDPPTPTPAAQTRPTNPATVDARRPETWGGLQAAEFDPPPMHPEGPECGGCKARGKGGCPGCAIPLAERPGAKAEAKQEAKPKQAEKQNDGPGRHKIASGQLGLW